MNGIFFQDNNAGNVQKRLILLSPLTRLCLYWKRLLKTNSPWEIFIGVNLGLKWQLDLWFDIFVTQCMSQINRSKSTSLNTDASSIVVQVNPQTSLCCGVWGGLSLHSYLPAHSSGMIPVHPPALSSQTRAAAETANGDYRSFHTWIRSTTHGKSKASTSE